MLKKHNIISKRKLQWKLENVTEQNENTYQNLWDVANVIHKNLQS